jgi:hypothetical protein
MWDRWGVYKDTLEITEVKTWEEDDDKWNRTWCRYDKRPSIW